VIRFIPRNGILEKVISKKVPSFEKLFDLEKKFHDLCSKGSFKRQLFDNATTILCSMFAIFHGIRSINRSSYKETIFMEHVLLSLTSSTLSVASYVFGFGTWTDNVTSSFKRLRLKRSPIPNKEFVSIPSITITKLDYVIDKFRLKIDHPITFKVGINLVMGGMGTGKSTLLNFLHDEVDHDGVKEFQVRSEKK